MCYYRRDDQYSKRIYLTKGNLYYMEILHKEKTLIDFMCVGVKFPTLNKERPISSRHLVMESAGTKGENSSVKGHCHPILVDKINK